jgi:hypothetical protein
MQWPEEQTTAIINQRSHGATILAFCGGYIFDQGKVSHRAASGQVELMRWLSQ